MNKKGLNRRGHLTFSLGIFIVFMYFLKQQNVLSKELLTILIFHLPIFLLFSLFADWVESGGHGLISHRQILHSKRVLFLSIVSLPFLLYFSITYEKILFNLANYYSIALAGVGGHLSHMFGDSLTSRLRR